MTEENFDEVYAEMVGQYSSDVTHEEYARLETIDQGRLFLNINEDADLNNHGPTARDFRIAATTSDGISQVLALMPDFGVDLHFWGLGETQKLSVGQHSRQ